LIQFLELAVLQQLISYAVASFGAMLLQHLISLCPRSCEFWSYVWLVSEYRQIPDVARLTSKKGMAHLPFSVDKAT